MIRNVILLSAVLVLPAYGEERENAARFAGHEFMNPLLRERALLPIPENEQKWKVLKGTWMERLKKECFSGWPDQASREQPKEMFMVEKDGVSLRAMEYTSMGRRLMLYMAHKPGLKDPELVVLNLLDAAGWQEFLATMKPGFEEQLKSAKLPEADGESFKQHQGMFRSFKWVMAYAVPAGVGPTRLGPEHAGKRNLRLQASGHTIDSVRVWDARRAVQTLRSSGGMGDVPLWLQGSGRMAGVLLYASLFERDITRLDLHDPPLCHKNGPFFYNVLRIMNIPQALAVALEHSKVVVYQQGEAGWEYPVAVATALGWQKKLQLRSSRVEN